ncbi:2-C-methyl-D-erythritol 4-phosphate cytidylyltransferase [uncultured Desulfovibrio sp.]|uniref:2-C-methyl-D-erythritol 4-phosphate cytidylyltransferase n=1 Tax=uncultured Desulfovibrio sp. TaxID=167968 RepID=UPI0026373FF5|nr:2-C-methyl-D-erythritol 4-phosphate cytidylyltransferase [uncultured Desulfovibrio sp.]
MNAEHADQAQEAPAASLLAEAPRPWALLLAAGRGSRMAAATGGTSKQFLIWKDSPLYWHSALTFSRSSAVAGIVFVFPPGELARCEAEVRALDARQPLGLPWAAVEGGAERDDSVRNGLAALPGAAVHVLIHDAARPFMSARLVRTVQAELAAGAVAVIPALPVTDTIKMVEGARVLSTLPRHRLVAVQTPQGFARAELEAAHAARMEEAARGQGQPVTDDAMLMEAAGHAVRVVPGEKTNVKITTVEDMALLSPPPSLQPRTGMGYDVHRYAQDAGDPKARPMKLGGIAIDKAPAVLAHSDGDVLLHALCDALLGCACLGDIGEHFPDADARFDNISSAILLDQVLTRVRRAGLRLCHADMTIVAQRPRLAAFKDAIRRNVARLLQLPPEAVNVKATTEERLGFTGREEGIKAYAVVSALYAPPAAADAGESHHAS